MAVVRWGIIGCGDVTEVKSGPGFQKATGSALVAVTRRDRAKAEDYARRHGVPRVHGTVDDLILDAEVDAVYVATPPASHAEIALRVAAARKPCLVEKPMAASYAECTRMLAAFQRASVPLWVAYYRRALPRFLLVRDLLRGGSLGRVTSVQLELRQPLASAEAAQAWRFNRALAGGGLFYDMGSHAVDLLDFLFGPIEQVRGLSMNTGGAYEVEDVTVAIFRMPGGFAATGLWNFNAGVTSDTLVVTTSQGEIRSAVFEDADVIVTRGGEREVHQVRNPPHVHQPLIQSIVDELAGCGRCESTGVSGARASRLLEMCAGGRAVADMSGVRAALRPGAAPPL
jgi:1,5-anhydro-D-fructose reductase (1,5-anhydro-D-mannitol-forming)